MAVTNSNSKTVDRKFEASLDWSTWITRRGTYPKTPV
jgi:hypothetical protein